ncbi:hypothetical protein BH11VER1_BH11VER1_05490 [soil metagenome]
MRYLLHISLIARKNFSNTWRAISLCSALCALGGQAPADNEPILRSTPTAIQDGWVTVSPPEFQGAINNPLKGFREYKEKGYGLLERQYIKWSDIEVSADDTVERIIAHTNEITKIKGKRFEDLNIKLVPRVYLDWNGEIGSDKKPKQYWPADLHTFDYDSPAFQDRLRRLVEKLGQAWDEDPRIFAVQMGIIGKWGEHHSPAPTTAQRRLLAEAFKKAFKHKPVLVRNTDAEYMEAGFGIYYDTFATFTREPPDGPKDQFPWQATQVHREIWKRGPIEGEVEYNWQQQREDANPKGTFGRTPDETMKEPAYRRYMIDKIRRYHTSYLGWIDNYDDSNSNVLAGAAELQKAFGYRFLIESASYPLTVQPGEKLNVKLTVRNTGSAPFYLDWPVAVALLDPETKKPVWSAPLNGMDIRKWLPGEDWDSAAFAYRRAAEAYHEEGHGTLPADFKPGKYILSFAILDREGGMMPSVRFATVNYFRGGWHPLGFIGIGAAPEEAALKNIHFDDPAFDDSLFYKVPEKLRAINSPPLPTVKAVVPWTADPKKELINPWRYWVLQPGDHRVEKEIRTDGPVEGPAGRHVIRVTGDFDKGSSLNHNFGTDVKLDRGPYRFAFRVRGTPGQSVELELADDWRGVSKIAEVPLTDQWQEHIVEFEIKSTFKDETTLRFNLPKDVKGTFDLADTRLKRAE